MKHVPESLKKVRNEILNAILQSDTELISNSFAENISYKNPQNSIDLQGKKALKKKLVSLFEDKNLAVALEENHISVAGDKAVEWSNFTLFIDHSSLEKSISFHGNCSLIWEKSGDKKWVIRKIMDTSDTSYF